MAPQDDSRSGPPGPAPLERKFRLWPHQRIAIPLLLAVPVLGLAGVLDERTATGAARAGALELTVEYPAQARSRSTTGMELRVRNTGRAPLEDVRVRLDPAFLDGFTELNFTPSPAEGFEVQLDRLSPGQDRVVLVGMRPDELWTNRGVVRAEAAGASPAEVEVRTFVLP